MKRPAEVFTKDTVQRLFGACGHGFHGARNRALLGVLYHAGLRIDEALALQVHDIVLGPQGEALLHVRKGKGSKQRVAVLRPAGLKLLSDYLQRKPRQVGLVFTSYEGEPLGTAAVRMLLPRLARKAGLSQRVHAHGFRHTHAIELVQAGVPLPFIRVQLGHSNLMTTQRYLDHVTPQAVVDQVLRAAS